MKIAVRTFALSLVIAGIAASAYSPKTTTGIQAVPTATPVPNCPLDSPGCGIW